MTTSPPLEAELDLRKLVVRVNNIEIQHLAGRNVGGVTAMAPDDVPYEQRVSDLAGTYVGWRADIDPVDTGGSGVISVLMGSPSMTYLSRVSARHDAVKVEFVSNGSGLGFKTQTLAVAKFTQSPISLEASGVRMYMFVGWDYVEVLE